MGSNSPDGKDDGLLDKTVRRGHRRSSWAVSKSSLLFFFLLLAAFFMLAAAMWRNSSRFVVSRLLLLSALMWCLGGGICNAMPCNAAIVSHRASRQSEWSSKQDSTLHAGCNSGPQECSHWETTSSSSKPAISFPKNCSTQRKEGGWRRSISNWQNKKKKAMSVSCNLWCSVPTVVARSEGDGFKCSSPGGPPASIPGSWRDRWRTAWSGELLLCFSSLYFLSVFLLAACTTSALWWSVHVQCCLVSSSSCNCGFGRQ